MSLSPKIYFVLIFVFISYPTPILSQFLNDQLMVNSEIIAQIYISDPYLNELLIQGMGKGIQGDYQGAIAIFTEIVQLSPNEVEAYYNRGIAYGKIQAYQAAIADFNQGLTLNQTMPDLYIERAKIYLQLGNSQAAMADLKKAKALLRQQGETSRYSEVDSLLNSR